MNKRKAALILLISVCIIACLLMVLLIINEKKEKSIVADDVSKTSFNATFLDFDEKIIEERAVEEGTNIVPPNAPYHDGYAFSGWSKSLTNIRSDMEYRAMYDEIISPSVVIENVFSSLSDRTASVQVYLLNNPGLSSTLLNLYYNDGLKLTKVEFMPEFGEYITAPEPYSNPQTISMISPMEDLKYSGVMATLTFEIDEEFVCDDCSVFDIDIMCDQENTFNADFKDVAVESISGSITVIK